MSRVLFVDCLNVTVRFSYPTIGLIVVVYSSYNFEWTFSFSKQTVEIKEWSRRTLVTKLIWKLSNSVAKQTWGKLSFICWLLFPNCLHQTVLFTCLIVKLPILKNFSFLLFKKQVGSLFLIFQVPFCLRYLYFVSKIFNDKPV